MRCALTLSRGWLGIPVLGVEKLEVTARGTVQDRATSKSLFVAHGTTFSLPFSACGGFNHRRCSRVENISPTVRGPINRMAIQLTDKRAVSNSPPVDYRRVTRLPAFRHCVFVKTYASKTRHSGNRKFSRSREVGRQTSNRPKPLCRGRRQATRRGLDYALVRPGGLWRTTPIEGTAMKNLIAKLAQERNASVLINIACDLEAIAAVAWELAERLRRSQKTKGQPTRKGACEWQWNATGPQRN